MMKIRMKTCSAHIEACNCVTSPATLFAGSAKTKLNETGFLSWNSLLSSFHVFEMFHDKSCFDSSTLFSQKPTCFDEILVDHFGTCTPCMLMKSVCDWSSFSFFANFLCYQSSKYVGEISDHGCSTSLFP